MKGWRVARVFGAAAVVLFASSALAQMQLPGSPREAPSAAPPVLQGAPSAAPVLPGARPQAPSAPPSAPPAPSTGAGGSSLRDALGTTDVTPRRPADPTGVRDLAEALAVDNNFNFPGLPAAILKADFDAIPDDQSTRALVGSYLRIMNEACGEQAVDLALAVLRYASDEFRGGFNFLWRAEGFADARYLLSRIGCVGNPFNAFVSNYSRLVFARAPQAAGPQDPVRFARLMSPAFRARNNVPDPDQMARDRTMAEVSRAAVAACMARYAHQGFCQCAIGAIRALRDEPELLRAVATSFDRIVMLPVDLAALERRIIDCERQPDGAPR